MIPNFESIMLPLLEILKGGKERSIREVVDAVAKKFNLSEQEKDALQPSGRQPVLYNRVGWARLFLKRAGLLEDPQRGFVRITDAGEKVLSKKPKKIDIKYLDQFPDFKLFRSQRNEQKSSESVTTFASISMITPDEMILSGFNIIQEALGKDILDRLIIIHPSLFERTVLRLLSKMGYGQGQVTGRSGDGGIDGFVNQDQLGLTKVAFQAKRYRPENTIGAGTIRDFIGALDVKKVDKGVLITTSGFTKDAIDTASRCNKSLVLVDGQDLVKHMIEHELGVSTEKVYKIRRIDSDFFSEE